MSAHKADHTVLPAVQRVLAGDVSSYELVHNVCDRPLRAFIGARFKQHGGDFIDEVAARTHAFAVSNLKLFDPNKAAFQTWLCLRSLNFAEQVRLEWYGYYRPRDRKGRRQVVPRFETFDEEVHAQYVPAVPGPEEVRARDERSRVLQQEYESLAEQGRLSIACHDVEGLTFTQTARRLGIGVSRVRRERERALAVLKRRMQQRGIQPFDREPAPTRIDGYGQSFGDEDDWCASVTAGLPDGPDTLVGADAKDEREEVKPV